jgi:hypothetical protein
MNAEGGADNGERGRYPRETNDLVRTGRKEERELQEEARVERLIHFLSRTPPFKKKNTRKNITEGTNPITCEGLSCFGHGPLSPSHPIAMKALERKNEVSLDSMRD